MSDLKIPNPRVQLSGSEQDRKACPRANVGRGLKLDGRCFCYAPPRKPRATTFLGIHGGIKLICPKDATDLKHKTKNGCPIRFPHILVDRRKSGKLTGHFDRVDSPWPSEKVPDIISGTVCEKVLKPSPIPSLTGALE